MTDWNLILFLLSCESIRACRKTRTKTAFRRPLQFLLMVAVLPVVVVVATLSIFSSWFRKSQQTNTQTMGVVVSPSTKKDEIKAILFDMDGTLLDTEALSDKAVLLAFGTALPEKILQKAPMSEFRLPWELKKQILGLRGKEWVPIVKAYAVEHWQVEEAALPTTYVLCGCGTTQKWYHLFSDC